VRPELSGLEIADPPARWTDLGFEVVDGQMDLGGVRVRLGAAGHGIVSWTLRGVEAIDIDGLATSADTPESGPDPAQESGTTPARESGADTSTTARELGATAAREFGANTSTPAQNLDRTPNGIGASRFHIDHVVVVSPDFDRTSAALGAAGMPLRRIRDAGGFRQGFRRLGPAILELVEARDVPDGPATFWGLAVTVPDLDALADSLGDRLGTVRDAGQPGRRIATVRSVAGIGPALAFMDPGG
jgi:hypothetical protein